MRPIYPRLLVAALLVLGLVGIRPERSFAATTLSDCPTTERGLSTDISNAGTGGTVSFTCTSPTTIPFTSTITITQSVTLDASGASGTVTLDGGGKTQLLDVFRGFTLSLRGLTLAHGSADFGGAIVNRGTVSIASSSLSGNSATYQGGAIANVNTLTITSSTLSANSAFSGGAIENEGRVSIASSSLSGNSTSYAGGAIANNQGTLSISNSTFSANSAPSFGGAIDNVDTTTISDSSFSGNSAFSGAAIFNWSGTETITSSSLSGNSAPGGGAIYNKSGTVSVGGTIIANTPKGGNCGGVMTDSGYNLSDDSGCGFSAANHDLANTNPQLGPLQNNGGPSKTMALLSNSPAIDVIPATNTLCSSSSTDQRGDPRPDESGTACDIGAYESSYLDTTTTLTSSPNPSAYGQSVTFTATITTPTMGSAPPTGTVDFFDGSTRLGSGTVSTSNGVTHARFTTSSLAAGNHSIAATYSGDVTYSRSTVTATQAVTQVVNKADTSTTVTSSVNPSTFGQSVTFTATISAVTPGAGTPTGTVTFLDGGSPIGTGPLRGGAATFSTSALSVGNHTITTSYGGDGNFNGSTGSLTGNPLVVNKADTTTTMTSSVNPSVYGQSATFTAAVSAAAPGAGTPTGTVTFFDSGSSMGTGTLSGGVATFTTSALTPGAHTITAFYSSDGNFNGGAGSLTGNSQVVNKANTTTTVTSSSNPSVYGQAITFRASVGAVAPGAGTPTGTVTFLDGGSPIGTGTLSGGVATFTTSALAVRDHTITTSYVGDGNFNGSTGSLAGNPQVVNMADTTTTITSSVNPSASGQPVSFTATVTVNAPGSGNPTGSVQFSVDGTNFGHPVSLSGGKAASQSTSSLAPGNHAVTAAYSGDANFQDSSASLTQTVSVSHLSGSLVSGFHPTEGHLVSGTVASVTDSNTYISASQMTATISWGDGSTSSGTAVSGSTGHFTVGGQHTYADEGSVLVSVTLQEQTPGKASGTASGSASVAEGDTLSPAASSPAPATAGQVYTGAVTSFTDANTANSASDFSATISWGDGTASSGGTVSGSGGHFAVPRSHTYRLPGQYTIKTTIRDDAPGTAAATSTSTLSVTVPGSNEGSTVTAYGSSRCSTAASSSTVSSAGSPSGTFFLRDERPGGTPCGPYHVGVLTVQAVSITAVVCTSHTTATIYGQAKQGTYPSTTASGVRFRADVAITSPGSTFNGTVSLQTSSSYTSGALPAAVHITGC